MIEPDLKQPRRFVIAGIEYGHAHPFSGDGREAMDAVAQVVARHARQLMPPLPVDNICAMLGNFLRCGAWENVVFCWVMQDKAIAENILRRLDLTDVNARLFTLMVSEKALRARLEADVQSGKRERDVIERSVARLPLYERMDTEKIDTDALTPDQIAEIIANRIRKGEKNT